MQLINPWTTLSADVVYDNKWIQVTHRDVINPNGGKGIYGVVHFKNLAIGILPLDREYNTWLVGQYRYTMNEFTWEMPEGGGALHEPPLVSAQRELLEETGIVARQWTHLLDIHTSNSVTDEYAVCFVAQDLTFTQAAPEETELLTVKKIPFAELVERVMRGDIKDSLTICAVLKAERWIAQGLL